LTYTGLVAESTTEPSGHPSHTVLCETSAAPEPLLPRPSQLIIAAFGLTLWACAGAAPPVDDLGYDGTGIAVTVAPLNLPGVTDACYSFEILNGAATAERVVARGQPIATLVAGQGGAGGPAGLSGSNAAPLCSARFGDSQGAVSYVAPCDGSPGNEAHTVTLWLSSVCEAGEGWLGPDDGGTCLPLQGYINPCGEAGCTLAATCAENADTPVTFNLTIMAAAKQGFFDIGVNFDNVFCSAKVDCLTDTAEPLTLLHDPNTGLRGQTAVLGLACTAGPGDAGTVLLRDPIAITCGADTFTLDPAQPEGNVYTATDGPNPAPAGSPVWQYAVYAGPESLTCGADSCNKVYWNVALGFDPTAAGCTLTTTATAGTAATLPELSTPEASTWPVIAVNVPLTLPGGGLACSAHPLNGEPAGVTTGYTEVRAEVSFATRFDGVTFSAGGPLSGTNCLAILTANPGAPNGFYTLDLDGDGPGLSRSYFCDMVGGGWTQLANQPGQPGPYLPDDQATVGAFGDNTEAYRLGGAEITAIAPTVAWRVTDADDTAYFRPECVVDWANDFSASNETSPRYCTTGYNDLAFTVITNGGWTAVAARGIGVNGACTLRPFFSVSAGWAVPGNALDCQYNDGFNEPVGLWFL